MASSVRTQAESCLFSETKHIPAQGPKVTQLAKGRVRPDSDSSNCLKNLCFHKLLGAIPREKINQTSAEVTRLKSTTKVNYDFKRCTHRSYFWLQSHWYSLKTGLVDKACHLPSSSHNTVRVHL